MASGAVAEAMEPWEQHHAVINMPRFAYNPASLLHRNPGFLITCTFRREKSATKEVIALLQEYVNSAEVSNESSPCENSTFKGREAVESDKQDAQEGDALFEATLVPSSEEILATSRSADKPCMGLERPKLENENQESVDESPRKGTGKSNLDMEAIENCKEGEGRASTEMDPGNISSPGEVKLNAHGNDFILVKLATMGVIYICMFGKSPSRVSRVASRIVKDVQAGTRVAPQWCHRMLPVQATCSMKREELQLVVSQLVKDHLRDHVLSTELPIKYAVAFNRRGAGVPLLNNSTETTVLGREECIKIVTSAVEQVTTTIKVDLTSPQMVVVVELIPVAGIQSSLICAISVLSGDLIISKPRLNVKPLAPQCPKSRKRKHLR